MRNRLLSSLNLKIASTFTRNNLHALVVSRLVSLFLAKATTLLIAILIIPLTMTACNEPEAIIIEPQITQYSETETTEITTTTAGAAPSRPSPEANTPYLANHGRQVTKDFLANFPHTFNNENTRATGFALYDLDGSGIPHILIFYSPIDRYEITNVLYGFVDGQFTPIHTFPSMPTFFHDEQGRVVVHFNDDKYGYFGFYYLDFLGNEVILASTINGVDSIYDWDFWNDMDNMRAWDAHHSGTQWRENPTIFSTNTPITRIPSLYDLASEITSVSHISEFGRQVTKDFLYNFPSIFSFGWKIADTDQFRHNNDLSISYDPPLVWGYGNAWGAGGGGPYFDNHGNIIEDAPFLYNHAIAWDFFLVNLENSGIPAITIRFGIPDTCAGFFEIYRLINGEFTPIHRSHASPRFFHTDQGRLVMMLFHGDGGENGYYFMDFEGDDVVFTPIITEEDDNWDEREWHDFHAGSERDNIIFNTDIPITHIPRLHDLTTEITESIMQRLYSQPQTVEDFLSQFHSIFSFHFGDYNATDALVHLSWERENAGYRDRQGNIIDSDAAFLRNDGMAHAGGFNLYDLNGDDIPEIVIAFGHWGSSMVWYEVFTLIDNEFQSIEIFPISTTFYRDAEGRLIAAIPEKGGFTDYYYMVIANGEVILDNIFRWHDYEWNDLERHYLSAEFQENPTIFSTDIALTSARLDALQFQVTESIMQRLGLQ